MQDSRGNLYWFTLPFASGGVRVAGCIVQDAAPIMRWSEGKTIFQFAEYVWRHKGEIECLTCY